MSNDSAAMQYYYDTMKKYPVLKKDEELKIARRAKKGDLIARDLLVRHNIGIVISLAKRLQVKNIPLEDLVQEGMAGFVHAIDEFNPSRGFRISTYASWWVNAYIRKYLKMHSGPLRMPGNKRKDGNPIQVPFAVSMSTPIGTNDDGELIDLFADEAPAIDEAYEREEQAIDIRNAARYNRTHGKIGKDIIVNRLMADEPETLQTIGERHNLSRERIRQMEADVIKKLRGRLMKYAECA